MASAIIEIDKQTDDKENETKIELEEEEERACNTEQNTVAFEPETKLLIEPSETNDDTPSNDANCDTSHQTTNIEQPEPADAAADTRILSPDSQTGLPTIDCNGM